MWHIHLPLFLNKASYYINYKLANGHHYFRFCHQLLSKYTGKCKSLKNSFFVNFVK